MRSSSEPLRLPPLAVIAPGSFSPLPFSFAVPFAPRRFLGRRAFAGGDRRSL
jgi:hypothetical protein